MEKGSVPRSTFPVPRSENLEPEPGTRTGNGERGTGNADLPRCQVSAREHQNRADRVSGGEGVDR